MAVRKGIPKLYLYLAKRDKKAVKILTEFAYKKCSPRRVTDIESLNLSKILESKIKSTILDHGLKWEVWIESATSYRELCKSFSKRRYKNIPMLCTPVHPNMPLNRVIKKGESTGVKNPTILGPQAKKMIRKKR